MTAALEAMRAHAFAMPEAWEDHPWGESVAKVGKKVFVFFGRPGTDGVIGFSVKLPITGEEVLEMPFATPTGYGLGKSGWVTMRFTAVDLPSVEILRGFIDESYAAVAPRKLVQRLREARGPAARDG